MIYTKSPLLSGRARHEYRRDFNHYRWCSLRHRSWICETKQLQSQDWNGVSSRRTGRSPDLDRLDSQLELTSSFATSSSDLPSLFFTAIWSSRSSWARQGLPTLYQIRLQQRIASGYYPRDPANQPRQRRAHVEISRHQRSLEFRFPRSSTC